MRNVQTHHPKQCHTGLSRLSLLFVVGVLLLTDLPIRSQQPITVDVNAVNLLATVRDKHANIIRNLAKDDFALDQDGKPQTITYFAKESDLPLTLGLLVDTSMSQRRVLDQELSASRSFLDQVLREDKDRAFVIHFDREVELDQELTSSRQKLRAAIDQINSPQFSQTGASGRSGGGRGSHGGGGAGTLLYDAVFLASDELMKKQQGRKAVILLTDGVDHGSKETLEEAIETAQRADTLVYCILFADKEGYGNGGGFGGPHMGGMGGRGGRGRRLSETHAKNRIPTEKKFSNRCPKPPAAASLKFPRKNRSTRSMRPSTKNCAISTAWGTTLIDRPLPWAITSCISSLSKRT